MKNTVPLYICSGSQYWLHMRLIQEFKINFWCRASLSEIVIWFVCDGGLRLNLKINFRTSPGDSNAQHWKSQIWLKLSTFWITLRIRNMHSYHQNLCSCWETELPGWKSKGFGVGQKKMVLNHQPMTVISYIWWEWDSCNVNVLIKNNKKRKCAL